MDFPLVFQLQCFVPKFIRKSVDLLVTTTAKKRDLIEAILPWQNPFTIPFVMNLEALLG